MKRSAIFIALLLASCATPGGGDNIPFIEDHRIVSSDGWIIGSRRFDYASRRAEFVARQLFIANESQCPYRIQADIFDERLVLCGYGIKILRGGQLNAFTDGKFIHITEGVARLGKEQQAFIIAHELAHSVLGHDIENGSRVDLELEADVEAIRLMHRAGLDVSSVPVFILNSTYMEEASDTHPSTKDRIKAVEGVMAELGLL